MSQITGKEILKRKIATLKEILQSMKRGLPATNQDGDQIYDINDFTTGPSQEDRVHATRRYTNRRIQKPKGQSDRENISEFPDGYHGISMEIPTNPEGQARAMKIVGSLLFSC